MHSRPKPVFLTQGLRYLGGHLKTGVFCLSERLGLGLGLEVRNCLKLLVPS